MKTRLNLMRNTIAAMAAFSGVMGVGSAWGYGLEATDWVGKGANTLASTGANWNNGVVPSASMRFAAGAYGKTVTFDRVYTITGYIWNGTDDPGKYYDPSTGVTNPVVWEATSPGYGINHTNVSGRDAIIVGDANVQNAALHIKSGTYYTSGNLRVAFAKSCAGWFWLEEGSFSCREDLRVGEGSGAKAEFIVGSGDPSRSAKFYVPVDRWAVVSASGANTRIVLKKGGEFHCSYICEHSTTSGLVFDGGALVKDGASLNQADYIFGDDLPTGHGLDPNLWIDVTANGGLIDIGEFNTKLLTQIRLVSGATDGVLTKRGTGTLTLANAGSGFGGTFRVQEGTLALAAVGANTKAVLAGGTLTYTSGTFARLEVEGGTYAFPSLPAHTGKVIVSGGTLQATVNSGLLRDGVPYRTGVNVQTDLQFTGSATAATVFTPFRLGDFDCVQSVDSDGYIVLTPTQWTVSYTIQADSTDLNIGEVIGSNYSDVHKYGSHSARLTAKNAFTGNVYIHEGALLAARGTGVTETASIRIDGGTWAPLVEEATLPLGSGMGQVWFTTPESAAGISAFEKPLTLTFDSQWTSFVPGSDRTPNTTLILNGAGANQPLILTNPIRLEKGNGTIEVDGTGPVTLLGGDEAGGANRNLFKTGAGTLNFNGPVGANGAENQWLYIYPQAGTVSFNYNEATNKVADIIQQNASKVYLTNNAALFCNGWYYTGESGTGAVTYMSNGWLGTPVGNYLRVGYNLGSVGTFNFSGGTLEPGRLTVGGLKGRGTFNMTGGTLKVGGTGESMVGQTDAPGKNEARAAESVFTLSNGKAVFGQNFQVGVHSDGRFEQSGGVLDVTAWLSIARWNDAKGVYNMTGGEFYNTNAWGVIVGELGKGQLNLSGANTRFVAKWLQIGSGVDGDTLGDGLITVKDGAKLIADAIAHGLGTNNATLYVDGGTVGAYSSDKILSGYFRNMGGGVAVGPRGMTFDTGSSWVDAGDFSLAGTSSGTITKTGTGTLAMTKLPEAAKVTVAEGTLAYSGEPSASALVHRWSFNNSLADSVGGQTAQVYTPSSTTPPTTPSGTLGYTSDGKSISLPGGNNTAIVGLGSNILPTSGPVTIEIWSTLRSHTVWEKMFAVGTSQSNGLLLTYSCGAKNANNTSAVNWLNAGTGDVTGTGYYRDNEEYYMAVRFDPAQGGTVLTAYVIHAKSGAKVGSYTHYAEGVTVANISQTGSWLGWAWWNDAVPKANYNEVRVWNAALSESDMLAHVEAGPDQVFATTTDAGDNLYPENPSETLLANNYLTHRWTFNGTADDMVGGFTATLGGSSALVNNRQLDLVGGGTANGADLGANALPVSGPVTLEFWTTLRSYQAWEKLFAIGSSTSDYLLFTYSTQNATGNTSMGLLSAGANSGNMTGTGTCPLNVECYLAMTITPNGNGSTVTATLWNTETGAKIGTQTYTSDTWTPAQLQQNSFYLGKNWFNNPTPHASYNEVRVWNAALSEAQQQVNLALGPDVLPKLSPAASVGGAPILEVAAGATVDLKGGTIKQYAVEGSGRVCNGTLEVTGVLAPGGEDAVGTLTLESSTTVSGTIRLNVGDQIVCESALNLADVTIEVLDRENLKNVSSWTVASSAGRRITGRVKGDNLKGTSYIVHTTSSAVKIFHDGLFLFFR